MKYFTKKTEEEKVKKYNYIQVSSTNYKYFSCDFCGVLFEPGDMIYSVTVGTTREYYACPMVIYKRNLFSLKQEQKICYNQIGGMSAEYCAENYNLRQHR